MHAIHSSSPCEQQMAIHHCNQASTRFFGRSRQSSKIKILRRFKSLQSNWFILKIYWGSGYKSNNLFAPLLYCLLGRISATRHPLIYWQRLSAIHILHGVVCRLSHGTWWFFLLRFSSSTSPLILVSSDSHMIQPIKIYLFLNLFLY